MIYTLSSATWFIYSVPRFAKYFVSLFPQSLGQWLQKSQRAGRLSALLWKASSFLPYAKPTSVTLPNAYEFELFHLKERGKPTPKSLHIHFFLSGSRWWGGAGREGANRIESKHSIHNASHLSPLCEVWEENVVAAAFSHLKLRLLL